MLIWAEPRILAVPRLGQAVTPGLKLCWRRPLYPCCFDKAPKYSLPLLSLHSAEMEKNRLLVDKVPFSLRKQHQMLHSDMPAST